MKQKNRPLYIGITGNAGAGKSTIAKHIESHGYKVIYVDKIGHDVLYEKQAVTDLTKMFGRTIIVNDQIDRKILRKIVFSDIEQLLKLNGYTHRRIVQRMQDIVDSHDNPSVDVLFFEVPLLFEYSLDDCFDYKILVIAEADKKVKRVMRRDECSLENAEKILENQYRQDFLVEFVEVVIDNNFDINATKLQVDIFLQTLKFLKKKRKIKNFFNYP